MHNNIISFQTKIRYDQHIPEYVVYHDSSQEESQHIFQTLEQDYDYLRPQESSEDSTRCIPYSQEYKEAVRVGQQLTQLNQIFSQGKRFLEQACFELQRLKDWMQRLKDPPYEGSTDQQEIIEGERSIIDF